MPFIQELPQWGAAGTKPPQSKLDTGWAAGDKPPADWLNWKENRTYLVLQELQNDSIHEDQKGGANGVAPLGADSKIDNKYLNITQANAFTSIKAGANTVTPDTTSDTLEFVAGNNITLSADPATDKITINATVPSQTAANTSITDAGDYYTGANTELALQEIGQTLNAMRGNLITSANSLLGG